MKNKNLTQFIQCKSIHLILLIIPLIFLACTNVLKQESLEEMVNNAKQNADIITVEDFEKTLNGENVSDYILIDCRQKDDFLESHIPGAINISRGTLEFSNKISNRRDKIIIYGYNDACSALATETLRKLKYRKVQMIENGWKGWSAKYPELFETGAGEGEVEEAPKVESSGGCG